jgi:hypothetical protein
MGGNGVEARPLQPKPLMRARPLLRAVLATALAGWWSACESVEPPALKREQFELAADDRDVGALVVTGTGNTNTLAQNFNAESARLAILQRNFNDFLRAQGELARDLGIAYFYYSHGANQDAKAAIRRLAAIQFGLDQRLTAMMAGQQAEQFNRYWVARRASRFVRVDGRLDSSRLEAYTRFIVEGAVGTTPEALLGKCLRGLRSRPGEEGQQFQALLRENSRIAALSEDNFKPRLPDNPVETYEIKLPLKMPDRAGWELYVVPKRSTYHGMVKIICTDQRSPKWDWKVAGKRIHSNLSLSQNALILPDALRGGSTIRIEIISYSSLPGRNDLAPLRPDFYLVANTFGDIAAVTTFAELVRFKVDAEQKRNPEPIPRPFFGGGFFDLLIFAAEQNADLQGDALQITREVTAEVERYAYEHWKQTTKELEEIRSDLLKFHKDVLVTLDLFGYPTVGVPAGVAGGALGQGGVGGGGLPPPPGGINPPDPSPPKK